MNRLGRFIVFVFYKSSVERRDRSFYLILSTTCHTTVTTICYQNNIITIFHFLFVPILIEQIVWKGINAFVIVY